MSDDSMDDFIDDDSFSDDFDAPPKPAKKASLKKTSSSEVGKPSSVPKKTAKKSSAAMDIDDGDGFNESMQPNKSVSSVANDGKPKSIEQTYTKMEQHEHILNRPDMYIGATRRTSEEIWVWDEPTQAMVMKNVTYSPGLYKIFDEVLVNAADNYQRDPTMKFIKVVIDPSEGVISVHNDGEGIPIEIHKEHKKYVPELIFGDLLTGSNFDDTTARVTGGRNGLGAKLANIYSTEFIVETASGGKHFRQVFSRNMYDREKPVITAHKGKDFTKITFKPDYQRFDGMTEMDPDIVALFQKRVYDVAGCNSRLNVWLNGEPIQIKTFKDYVSLYFKSRPEDQRPEIVGPEILIDADGRKRWEVAVTVSNGDFQQISFVNSIWTIRGGTHVQALVKKITDQLQPKIKRRNKGTEVKPAMIRNHMFLFVNSLINNPDFDSQTKETLKSNQTLWGTKPDLQDSFYDKIAAKSGIIDQILLWNQGRSEQVLKTTTTKKRGRLGISKLTEANMAATAKSDRCTLIITEGDSAKGLALAGLSVVGRDYYGIFPLRGKVLNVRDTSMDKVVANEELNMIKQTMGLQHGKNYSDVSALRYGKIMIMTDQDHDGSHIKGLFINFIHNYWPSLLKIPGFLTEFITPIVKVSKGDETIPFFTIPQYQEWCSKTNTRGWKAKYYKGLGTSEPAEMQEYFGELAKHKKEFRYVGPQDDSAIQLAFDKKNSNARKEWLANYKPGTHLDPSLTKIPYNEFIDKELILFSLEDCERSIASMMDGFKPGQRKIMYACFKRNLKGEIKIAQLSGYVLEHCAYHHGDTSLHATMIGMAQNFVGSNNLNVLEPIGNFGSRDQGGKDAAAARYIFTTLSPLSRYIFHPDDDEILNYLEDEGMQIEPSYYCPTVPLSLINGNAGIGTGWSSNVPNYNPRDVVANLRRLLNDEEPVPMMPWYRGFLGSVEWNEKKGNFLIKGCWSRIDDESIEITELPIGSWTQSYKDALEKNVLASEEMEKKAKAVEKKKAKEAASKSKDEYDHNDNEEEDFDSKKKSAKKTAKKAGKEEEKEEAEEKMPFPIVIKDFKEYHTTSRVHFVIYSNAFKDMSDEEIEKKMKLTASVAISNMHLFDGDCRIKKYPSPEDILKDFFNVRIKAYERRKNHLVDIIGKDLKVLNNKARFIRAVINKEIVVSNRKKSELFSDLRSKGFDPIPKESMKKKVVNDDVEILPEGETKPSESDVEIGATEIIPIDEDAGSRDYDYLLSMPIWSLTAERVKKLLEQVGEKEKELVAMKAVHPADLWERDLDAFLSAWDKYEQNMTILDDAGVGGSAFRKPTMQATTSGSSGSGASNSEMKKKKEAILTAFKKLQKLAPAVHSKSPPVPKAERKEIKVQEVKFDPIIPPVKVKKGDPGAMEVDGVDGSKPTTKGLVKGQKSITAFFKKEEVPQLTEEEILALPLAERLAFRAKQAAASSKDSGGGAPNNPSDSPSLPSSQTLVKPEPRRLSLDDIQLSSEDEEDTKKTKPKRPAAAKRKEVTPKPSSTNSQDPFDKSSSDEDHQPPKKKAKATSTAKKASRRKKDDEEEEGDFSIESDGDGDFGGADSEEDDVFESKKPKKLGNAGRNSVPKKTAPKKTSSEDPHAASEFSFTGTAPNSKLVKSSSSITSENSTSKPAASSSSVAITKKPAKSSSSVSSVPAAPKPGKSSGATTKVKKSQSNRTYDDEDEEDVSISLEGSEESNDYMKIKVDRPKRERKLIKYTPQNESDSDSIELDDSDDY